MKNNMKAFLSHSSKEKDFIRVVAEQVGRAKINLDKYFLSTGDEVLSAIQEAIKKSELFILFVSKSSLDSLWVKIEIEEAYFRYLEGKIKPICIIIDENINFKDLPQWLKKFQGIKTSSPKMAARQIETYFINSSLSGKILYIGREDQSHKLAERLEKYNSPQPLIFSFSGLPYVGRRTFAEKELKSKLELNIGPLISILPEYGFLELYLNLKSEIEEFKDYEKEKSDFEKLNPEDKQKEIIRLLTNNYSSGYAVILEDRGGLLNDDGSYKEEFRKLLTEIINSKIYLIIKHTRRIPLHEQNSLTDLYYSQNISPLTLSSSIFLLDQLNKSNKIGLSEEEVKELASYMDGLPQAAYWIIKLIEVYGVSSLIADKSVLIDLKERAFSPLLEAFNLTALSWDVLRLLTNSLSLPLEAITVSLSKDESTIVKELNKLIEFNLVLVSGKLFEIAFPIRNAVTKARGTLTPVEYEKIAKSLKVNFWRGEEPPNDFNIIEAALHATLRSGKILSKREEALIPASSFARAAQQAYDSESYDIAERLAKKTIELDNRMRWPYEVLLKTYVRLNEHKLAEDVLKTIQLNKWRTQYYLSGFIKWKKGLVDEAIADFYKAVNRGDNRISVHRDLAVCLALMGRVDEAKDHFEIAHKRDSSNKYVLDLGAKIAIQMEDYSRAEELIAQLERIDTEQNVAYRKGILLSNQKKWPSALEFAKSSISTEKPRFEAYTLYINCLIENDEYKEAKEMLTDLNNKWPNRNHDVKIGLECKYFIRIKNWKEAYKGLAFFI